MLASTCFGASDEGRAFRGNPGQAGGVAKTGLKAAGVKHEIYRYDSAHAFANERSAAFVMLEDFDPSTVRGNPVYRCGVCENNNDLPFAASDGRHWPSR
jgi:hypothetical protein